MKKDTLFESEEISVWYYPQLGLVHHQMHQQAKGQQFRDALSAGLEALSKHHGTKWLSDDRKNYVLPTDDEHWAQTQWFPRTKKAGWKYWAIVQPASAVGQMNMRRFAETYEAMGIVARLFSDPDEALAWLRTCDGK